MAFGLHLIIPLIPFTFFIIFLLRWSFISISTTKKKLLTPPSPKKMPIIGNLHQLGTYPYRTLLTLSKKYGELMLLHFGYVPVLVVSSANAAQEIMKNQDLVFSNRRKSSITDEIFYGSKDMAFSPYGEYWRQGRSICVLHLLSRTRVQSFRRVREEETSLMVEKILEMGSSSRVLNLSEVMSAVVRDVVCRVALGRKDEDAEEGNKFRELLGELVHLLGATKALEDSIPWLWWVDRLSGVVAKKKKMARDLDEFLAGVVKDHRMKRDDRMSKNEDGGEVNFVDILLEFQEENKDTSPIEDFVIKALILDIFAGGTHTTYAALEWVMVELLRHPKIMTKLQKEVREVAGDKEEITEDDLEKMPYLIAVLKEGLRLHPSVPLIPRAAIHDTKVLGYDIEAGTSVLVSTWALGRDPTVWKNPEEFYPDRFLETTIDYKGLHFEYLPFGTGRRGCPGMSFAMPINELALAKLVHRFDFKLPNGAKGEDLDVTEVNGLTVHRKLPLHVIAVPRGRESN